MVCKANITHCSYYIYKSQNSKKLKQKNSPKNANNEKAHQAAKPDLEVAPLITIEINSNELILDNKEEFVLNGNDIMPKPLVNKSNH